MTAAYKQKWDRRLTGFVIICNTLTSLVGIAIGIVAVLSLLSSCS